MPYKGAAPAVNDLAGGHVDTMFCDLGTILSAAPRRPGPDHRGGDAKADCAAARDPDHRRERPARLHLDDVLLADGAAGTPLEIREKLNKAIVAAMRTPEVEEKLKSIFVEASDLDVEAMDQFIKSEAKLWGGVIRAAKITVEQ